jgi:diacylglycerol kinase (ATP)
MSERSTPPPRRPHSPHTLVRSFGWAWTGLVEGARRERNLRLHLALGVLAASFAAVAPLAPAERALVLLCVAIVPAAEAANSALEAAVDLLSPGWDERARIAKDAAAAAVLALSAGSVLVFLSVALPALPALAVLGVGPLSVAAGGAAGASLAAGVLPMPGLPRGLVNALAMGGLVGLVLVAWTAQSQVATAAAALLLAVAAGAARKR